MKRHLSTYTTRSAVLVVLVLAASLVMAVATATAATSPTLGAAGSYSVLAGTTVTCTGSTTVVGDVGVSPGSAITGFPVPCIAGPPGTTHAADQNAADAQLANTAAFGFIDQGPCTGTYQFGTGNIDLATANLVAGVYCADTFTLDGTLTLSGTGVWIFKSAGTLITSGSANVVGGDPCNVWWREVSSATLGTGTQLTGNILALTSITLNTGAALNGRALAQTGGVDLHGNVITGAACLTANTGPGTTTTTTGGGGVTAKFTG